MAGIRARAVHIAFMVSVERVISHRICKCTCGLEGSLLFVSLRPEVHSALLAALLVAYVLDVTNDGCLLISIGGLTGIELHTFKYRGPVVRLPGLDGFRLATPP